MPDFEQPNNWADRPHVVLLVDESGSMSISRESTISSINDYLGGLSTTLPAETRVTVVKFDSGYNTTPNVALISGGGYPIRSRSENIRIEKLFNQTPLSQVRKLTLQDYSPRGGTPLNDAIGRTIRELDQTLVHDNAPVYFAILTDGEENSSVEFNSETVRQLITARQEKGWTVTFMGVSMDAYAASHSYGITVGNTVNLSRATMAAGLHAMSSTIGAKFATASKMGSAEAYATWNSTDDSFKPADKAKLEE